MDSQSEIQEAILKGQISGIVKETMNGLFEKLKGLTKGMKENGKNPDDAKPTIINMATDSIDNFLETNKLGSWN